MNNGAYTYNLGYEPTEIIDYVVPFQNLNLRYADDLDGVEFKKVCVYTDVMIALDKNGNVWSWGKCDSYMLGREALISDYKAGNGYYDCQSPKTVTIPNDEKIIDIAINNNSVVAVSESGKIYSWGYQLYNVTDSTSYSREPVELTKQKEILEGKNILKVEAGYSYFVFLDSNGEVYTLSNNSTIASNSLLTKIEGVIAKDIYAGYDTLIIKDISNDLLLRGKGYYVSASNNELKKINNITPNELYNTEVDKIIDSYTFSAKYGEQKKIYTLNSLGEINQTIVVDSISECKSMAGLTIIIDGNKNMYYKKKANNELIIADKSICVKEIYEGKNYILVLAENGKLYKTNTSTYQLAEVTGFDEGAVFVNISVEKDGSSAYIECADGSFWRVNSSVKKMTNYVGTSIKEVCYYTSSTSMILDADKNLWRYSTSACTKKLENVEKIIVCPYDSANAWAAMTSDGQVYTEGYASVNYSYSGEKYYRFGDTVESVYSLYNVSENNRIPEQAKDIYFIKQSLASYSEAALIVVTQTNQIYGCLPGYTPIKATYENWGNIVDSYEINGIRYFMDDKGNTLRPNAYLNWNNVRGCYVDVREGIKVEDGYVIYPNGDIGIKNDGYYEGSSFKIYNNISQLSVTNTTNGYIKNGLVLEKDGTLNMYVDENKKNLTGQKSFADRLAKRFVLLRNSKYCNKRFF